MKKFTLTLAAFLIGAASIFAQTTAREAAEKMTAKYSFDQTQSAEALKIEERRAKNLAEIESLRTSNPELFAKKTASAHIGARASYRRALKTPSQIAQYDAMIQELRNAKTAKTKELRARKATKSEIETATSEIEAQF